MASQGNNPNQGNQKGGKENSNAGKPKAAKPQPGAKPGAGGKK
jgi:hypothetical protein